MKKLTMRFVRDFLGVGLVLSLALAGVAAPAFALGDKDNGPANRTAPGRLNTDDVVIRAVRAEFVAELQGSRQSFTTPEPTQYRGVVVTLEIKKPANQPFAVFAPDISLHYYFGDKFDVLQCQGISGFSTERNTDRPMTFFEVGYGRSSTGQATAKADKIYVDVFFRDLEPSTGDIYVFFGQPLGAALRTNGWRP